MFVLPLTRTATQRALSARFNHSLEHLLDSSFDRPNDVARKAADVRTPALDVSETDAHYTLVLDLPGVTREQLKVSVEGRRVSVDTIALPPGSPVEANAPQAPAARELYRERSTARYARTVSLPTEVDQASSQARFENGVLTLTLVKKVRTGATQISIS